jgi:hypothetical protein
MIPPTPGNRMAIGEMREPILHERKKTGKNRIRINPWKRI